MLKIRKHKWEGKSTSKEHLLERTVTTWVSTNGRIQVIQDLDTNHIRNIVAKIERGELNDRKHFTRVLTQELIYRQNIAK